jgi:hypothetical protein
MSSSSSESSTKRSLVTALLLTFTAILWSAPAHAQIEQVTIGVDGVT